ncbi:MAG TPA: EpsI family protein [Vicinamibacterales bacterium]
MIGRTAIVVALLLGASFFGSRAVATEVVVERQLFDTLPLELEHWRGYEATPLADDVVALLGVDDYVHRTYLSASGVPVNLYAGYYHSQRQGDTIHSPQNCLPGAGWRPVSSTTMTIPVNGREFEVNQYVIQKGLDQQLVLYWYQGRGRVVANEYRNKALLMWDAATRHRTNGGLVRIIVPIAPNVDASREARAFATAVLPHLERLMP